MLDRTGNSCPEASYDDDMALTAGVRRHLTGTSLDRAEVAERRTVLGVDMQAICERP